MSLIAVTGVKGSPGATTAVIALAAVWPNRPLLADCDPAGGAVALRLPMGSEPTSGSGIGLLALAAEVRHGPGRPVWPHVRQAVGGLDVLVGLSGSEQAVAIGTGWAAIADELAGASEHGEVEVLADCGRLTAGSPATAVIERADLLVVVTRAEVEMLVHLRRELRRVTETRSRPVVVLVVAGLRETTAVRDTQRAVDTAGFDVVPVLGPLVVDPDGVAALHGGHWRDRSLLVRSARALSPHLTVLTARDRVRERTHGR